MTVGADAKSQALFKLGSDRRLAHIVFFPHRHPDATPEFHNDMVDLWSSSSPRVLMMALRGGAKSTVGEEEVVLDACFQRFRNAMIVGETLERAADRLKAIKYELEYNERLTELFGGMKGTTWNEDKIILQNNVCIQARGRDQSFRGVKHLDIRPDYLWADDYEDEEAVRDPNARKFWLGRFIRVIMAACDKSARTRITGTPLDEDCMLYNFEKERAPDGSLRWITRRYPIEYKGLQGERVPIWPSRYPLDYIDELKHSFEEQAMLREYMMEYMVQASNPELQRFKAEHIKVAQHVRAWQPTLAMYDPARTVKKATSSMTGKVVASWISNKLVVWESAGGFMLPNEMIDDVFRVEEEYSPIEIGVEEDGLNEWLMQPLRTEQTRRRIIVPIRPMKAPKGKFEFIGALQKFFAAGEIEFAKEMPELKKQLLAFPTGRIDIPNALAYMLLLRPGLPVFDGFGTLNVAEDLRAVRARASHLAFNVGLGVVTAVLVQHVDGAYWVLADWIREGDPGDIIKDIAKDASLIINGTPIACIGQQHFKQYNTTGLAQAVRKIPLEMIGGGDPIMGREELRTKMQTARRGQLCLIVSTKASWTLRAFSGGYARNVEKGGRLAEEPVFNHYRVLMEGLEAYAGVLPQDANSSIDSRPHYALNDKGVRYMTALPNRYGS